MDKGPFFPFSGKPGLNVDLEEPNNPLEYSELFIIPELPKLIRKIRNWYAKQFLENMQNLKIRYRPLE
jgi:hypothetical protein